MVHCSDCRDTLSLLAACIMQKVLDHCLGLGSRSSLSQQSEPVSTNVPQSKFCKKRKMQKGRFQETSWSSTSTLNQLLDLYLCVKGAILLVQELINQLLRSRYNNWRIFAKVSQCNLQIMKMMKFKSSVDIFDDFPLLFSSLVQGVWQE